jgi:hypothetical protein
VRSALVSLILSVFICVAAACGGSAPSQLFSGNPVDSGGSGDDSSMSQGDSGMPPPEDASSADTGSATDSYTAPPDVFTVPEAGPDDAPSSTWNIACGMTMCPGPAQLCCVSGPTGNQTDTCVTGMNNCNGQGDTPISCTSSAQCPGGQLCCGRMANGAYTDVACRMTCGGSNEYVFCDPGVPSDCSQPTPTCSMSTVLDGFSRCN